MSEDKPKIHVDDDWKEQAQREKEALAEEAKQSEEQEPSRQFPDKVDFTMHCASLATQAMMSLGLVRHPATNEVTQDFAQAKFLIDTLEMLSEKTKGNLNDEESEMLERMVPELQMAYVEVVKHAGQNKPDNDKPDS